MPASQACDYAVDSRASTLGFSAQSSLHPVRGTSSQVAGEVSAVVDGDRLLLEPMPAMRVRVSVESLSSGNALQDRQMWKLLDSKRSPSIVATLKSLAPGSGNTYRATGELVLAGRARSYDGALTIRAASNDLTVDGSLAVDIRDFGIEPPRLLGMTVRPEVTVTLHLVARAKGAS